MTYSSRVAYERAQYRAIKKTGTPPVKAQYDEAGNCVICGECGRCPGWHTPQEAEGRHDGRYPQ
jgi:predicted aldo/keto reductase-like oxidoreductase